MKSLLRKLRTRFFSGMARQSDLEVLYAQISGLLQIQNGMLGLPVLRALRGWAISPDAMAWILADLQERDCPTVVEFGSGQSTVILAAALRHRRGRLFSVEHDPEYSSNIQRQVAACGLSAQVEFCHAPLHTGPNGGSEKTYDLSALPEVQVDMALVDGPPLTNGLLTRLTPLRWAVRHLQPRGVVFVDDSARKPDQVCLEKLVREFPRLQLIPRSAEKGLVELRIT